MPKKKPVSPVAQCQKTLDAYHEAVKSYDPITEVAFQSAQKIYLESRRELRKYTPTPEEQEQWEMLTRKTW